MFVDEDGSRFAESLSYYEPRMATLVTRPVFGCRSSSRRVLEVQARVLSRWRLVKFDVVPAFRTR